MTPPPVPVAPDHEPPRLLPPRTPAVSRPDDIRRHNLALVLQQVHRDGPLSRAELTQRLALSRSTIGALVTDLSELGLVQESVPVGGERAGRPSHVVAPRPEGPYAVAVDVDVDRVTVAAVSIGGSVLWRRVELLEPTRPSTGAVGRVVAGVVDRLRREVCGPAWPFGIGVSVPGTVRTTGGVVEDAPNLAWHHEPLGPLLSELLPSLPVSIGNDADMGASTSGARRATRTTSSTSPARWGSAPGSWSTGSRCGERAGWPARSATRSSTVAARSATAAPAGASRG
jgi:hypothetical protein